MKKITTLFVVLMSLFLIVSPALAGGQGTIYARPYNPDPSIPYIDWISWRGGNANNFKVGWGVGIQILNMPGTHNWSIVREDDTIAASGIINGGNLMDFTTGYIIKDTDVGMRFKVYVDGKADGFQVK
ncbi:MAG: hypothetical protein PHT40_03585 [Patescibacteria group bacterium]|nr:hypothetical protein [Patescibacteria group bacterium]